MPTTAARRLAILAAARARRGSFLRLDPARLRFSLGASLGDVRVPLEVAADVRAIVAAAAAELAGTLVATHRFVPADERERLLRAALGAPPAAAPQRLAPTGGGPDLRAAARAGAEAHPALSGGILCAWMGPGGRGRSLVGVALESTKRALAEMADTGHREPTPLLVALALHAELAAAEPYARELLPAPPLDRYLGAAVTTGLWVAARAGVLRALRDAGRPEGDPLEDEVEVALSAGALLGARAPRPGGDLLYGLELAIPVPRADELVLALAGGGDPDVARATIARTLGLDDELARRAELAVAGAGIRERLARAVELAEEGGTPDRVGELRELLHAPGALASAVSDEGSRRELARALAVAADALPAPAASQAESAALALRSLRAREPAAALGLAREEAHAAWSEAAAALLADAALERLAQPVRRALAAPDPASAAAEWEAGRVYRVGARGPILRTAGERPLGHLFADVKDFTRRTGLLGRAPMAELLKEEFYGPILEAARPFRAATAHLGDEGTVTVNNLLGDAISISGDVQAMVGLARAIRATLDAYEERLRREVSRDEVARQLAAIAARHAAERAPVAAACAEASAGLAAASEADRPRLAARAAWLDAARARLEAEHERELARARGEELEAGVFIAHGPPPVVVVIDDPVFGRNRVAIADKVNESARGTARAPAARTRADAELAAERAARGAPGLRHAWSVFVDRPLAISVPAAEEEQALAALRRGDAAAAMRALAVPVRAALDEAGRAGAGELWNGGAALSEEALAAFLAAAGPARQVRRVRLEARRIPESLRERWFYGAGPLDLLATFQADGARAELFRRAGVTRMKGLEDVVVWELASAQGGGAALFQALGAEWLAAPPPERRATR